MPKTASKIPKATRRAWERMPRESDMCFAAFQFWLESGETRDRKLVAERFGITHSRVNAWAKRWDWEPRLQAWMDFLLAVQQKAIAEKARDAAVSWADRRLFIQEKEFELGQRLIEKAEMMLQFDPVEKVVIRTERVIKDGVEIDLPVVTELRPNKFTWRDQNQVIETASKLMRLAAEMATSHESVKVTVNSNIEQARAMYEKLRSDVLEKLKDAPPSVDRAAVLKELPAIAAKEWGVSVEELIPVEQLPAIEGELISSSDAEN